MDDQMQIHDGELERQMEQGDFVLAVVTATKPDFYKQAPLIPAADDQDMPAFVMHTGQHYDDLLGHGLEEYGVDDRVGVDLGIRGGLSQKSAELMTRIKAFADHLNDDYPDTTVLPIVHGDTLAAGIVPQAWMFATNQRVAHNEAGLRGMAPDYQHHGDEQQFIQSQFDGKWEIDRNEPFPEQYDTFVGSAASEYYLAPTELNREHLKREGYDTGKREDIAVIGNSVVDAVEMKERGLEQSVFDIYPLLEERDDWIRVDIHRRANLLPGRFDAIISAVIDLVEEGYNVNLVELNATKKALEQYGLREKMQQLDENNDNFLFTGLWKKHGHVYEFLKSGQCFAELTDSGSMQEELNHIDEAHCLTARFNTDRPETVFDANTNVLVPPISGEFMYGMIDHIYESDEIRQRMRQGESLYGSNVSEKIIEFLEQKQGREPFSWSHERAGFHSQHERRFDYL
ncbi:MAG: UDP-N-acetylglucosamine 2-epimerase [Candidatus Nanohaloarchaea archaeon]|nr:UDP-N-acetylglucosamine 2-epimerase [Candidatus Nanohaloarchaea archaeon]